MISSFERQNVPSDRTDRKESLPYPLFIIMKWERRILQAQASLKEIIILGSLLLLCWSDLKFFIARAYMVADGEIILHPQGVESSKER